MPKVVSVWTSTHKEKVMLKKILAAAALSNLVAFSAGAAEPIGGSYYVNSAANSSQTIISAAQNVNGLYIRTVAVACGGDISLSAVPPASNVSARTFFGCNPGPNGQGIEMLPTPLYLPPGYALVFNVTSSSQNQIYMTYDLSGQ
jgi:hypothetical protein